METENITYNSHQQGVTPEVFENTKLLKDMFKVLGYASDRKNKPYIAMIEGKQYPFYGVQFHPEKSNFEWYQPSNIPHQQEAILLSQHLANVFVSKARENQQRFDDTATAVGKVLIENYKRIFLGNRYFSEVFLFKSVHSATDGSTVAS